MNTRIKSLVDNILGEMGGIVALYFNGKVSQFEELPPPSDKQAMDRWYDWLKTKREKKNAKTFFVYVKQIFKRR